MIHVHYKVKLNGYQKMELRIIFLIHGYTESVGDFSLETISSSEMKTKNGCLCGPKQGGSPDKKQGNKKNII